MCVCVSVCVIALNPKLRAVRRRMTAAIHTGTAPGPGAAASKGHAAGAGESAGGGASVKRPLTAGPALGVSKRSRA